MLWTSSSKPAIFPAYGQTAYTGRLRTSVVCVLGQSVYMGSLCTWAVCVHGQSVYMGGLRTWATIACMFGFRDKVKYSMTGSVGSVRKAQTDLKSPIAQAFDTSIFQTQQQDLTFYSSTESQYDTSDVKSENRTSGSTDRFWNRSVWKVVHPYWMFWCFRVTFH